MWKFLNTFIIIVSLMSFCLFSIDKTVQAQRQPDMAIEFAPNQETDDDRFKTYTLSPSGEKLITTVNNEASVWNMQTKQLVTTFSFDEPLPFKAFLSAAFSPDENLIATGLVGTVKLWDATSGELIRTIRTSTFNQGFGTPSSVLAIAFHPDGRRMVTSESLEFGGSIQVWDFQTGEEMSRNSNIGGFTSLEILPDGKRVLASARSKALILSIQTGEILKQLPDGFARLSSDGSSVLIVTDGNKPGTRVVKMLNLSSSNTSESPQFEARSTNFSFSKSGKLVLFVETIDNQVSRTKIINVNSGNTIAEFASNGRKAFQMPQFSADGKRVVGMANNKIFFWDITDLTSSIPNAVNLDN